ncbi:metal ABC transporter solute-binding protein, Zn/Mn family [Saccharicrinis carchari]|nr:zinc ABC transporter substrate-binding protein [Saccharicrinis carchari]
MKKKIAAVLFGIAAIAIGSCKPQPSGSTSISVSIQPQKYLVQQLLGEDVAVNVLIPKGSSPATYAPSPVQMKELGESEVYLRIGHIGFEQAWTERIAEINPDLKIVDTSIGISYINGEDYVHGDHVHKGGIDPHVWTSPKSMLTVLANTRQALLSIFPEKREEILKRSTAIEQKVKTLDNEFKTKCESLTNKSFYIFHPAYTYLARDYGLEQISIEHKGNEPSAQWLRKLIDKAREQNIKAIFIQEEFDKRNAEILAAELNIPTVQVNPLSVDWENEMRQTLLKLEKALR